MPEATPGDIQRELQAVLMADDIAQIGLDLASPECNPEATKEVELFVALKVDRNEAVFLRDIVERFGKRPYGWPDNEVITLSCTACISWQISFSNQGNEVSPKKAYDYFVQVRKRGELRINKIRQHDEKQLQEAANLAKDLFSKSAFAGLEEKELFTRLREELSRWQQDLKAFSNKSQTGHFPGKAEVKKGLYWLLVFWNKRILMHLWNEVLN